ncbi:LacI family DNA-binding transcriptional regulator [Georgenia sp. AZ-5]|uniref:LacI family DNA-binding transcriptional regulator n=1 Tax=Georgenia sp. AZ-5 TaxID=3367526 RepID=UPI00375476D6
MVTIRDVARQAGVSPATVSRVVNGLVGCSEGTRLRVEHAVADLGYETNSLARGLKTRQTSMIGVLAPWVSDALASDVMSGVENAAREQGYAVMYGRTGLESAYAAPYLRTLRTYRASGVVLISSVIKPEFRQVLGTSIPMISVAITDRSGAPSISVDDEQAGYDAARHLLRLGHRRIGLLAGRPESVFVNGPRVAGYRRAMQEAGCAPNVVHGDFTYASGGPGLRALLGRDPGLTAVFAVSDEMGVAVVNELQRLGRRVPDDVSVLGFDDTPSSQHVYPPLSTVAQPLREMGELAVRKLLRGRELGSKILPHRVVERGSTGPVPP